MKATTAIAFLLCAFLASSSSACNVDLERETLIEFFDLTSPGCELNVLQTNLQCACGVLQALEIINPVTLRFCIFLFPPPAVWLEACPANIISLVDSLQGGRRIPLSRLRPFQFLSRASSVCFQNAQPTIDSATRFVSQPKVDGIVNDKTPNVLNGQEMDPDTEVSSEMAKVIMRQSNEDITASVQKCAKCLSCLNLGLCQSV